MFGDLADLSNKRYISPFISTSEKIIARGIEYGNMKKGGHSYASPTCDLGLVSL